MSLAHIKFACERLLGNNFRLRSWVREMLFYCPFLLPHTKSFYGFRHLAKKDKGFFLDVGANDGISALGFRQINRHYEILSIEPNPLNEHYLKRLKKKLSRFNYLLVGAGSKKGQMTLHMPYYRDVSLHTAASLQSDFIQTGFQRAYSEEIRKNMSYKETLVDIIPLDDLKLQPDIIKIDTEGFDYEVLLGLQKTITQFRPYILVEYSPELVKKFEDFCRKESYVIFSYDIAIDRFLPFNKEREFKTYREYGLENIFCIPAEKVQSLPVTSD